MQDTILLQYLSKKIHTHAYKLTIDGEITFSCCKVLAFQDTYIKDKDFLDFLLESLPQGIPCLRSIRQKNIYGIVTGHNAIYIVGPVSFASPVYLNCDYNELILEEEIEKYVPQVNPDDYLEDILFLNHMITGVESTTEQIIASIMTIREKYKNTLTIYYLKTMKIMSIIIPTIRRCGNLAASKTVI